VRYARSTASDRFVPRAPLGQRAQPPAPRVPDFDERSLAGAGARLGVSHACRPTAALQPRVSVPLVFPFIDAQALDPDAELARVLSQGDATTDAAYAVEGFVDRLVESTDAFHSVVAQRSDDWVVDVAIAERDTSAREARDARAQLATFTEKLQTLIDRSEGLGPPRTRVGEQRWNVRLDAANALVDELSAIEQRTHAENEQAGESFRSSTYLLQTQRR
jgi:hypothetical protein